MGLDIFGKASNRLGRAWSADGAAVSFSGTGAGLLGAGMIVQQVNIGYQQQVTRLYEIGSDYTYFVAGRVQGTMTVGRIVGPSVVMSAFYAAFGNVCNAKNNVMNLYIGTGCGLGSEAGVKAQNENAYFKISYVVLTNVGISVGAQDMVINEQLQLLFVSMENSDTGGSTGSAGGIAGAVGDFPPVGVGAGGVAIA